MKYFCSCFPRTTAYIGVEKKRILVHMYFSVFCFAVGVDILGELEFSKLQYKMPVCQVPREASNLMHNEDLKLFSTMLKGTVRGL